MLYFCLNASHLIVTFCCFFVPLHTLLVQFCCFSAVWLTTYVNFKRFAYVADKTVIEYGAVHEKV